MACATCKQARCVCEDRAVLGIPMDVVPPAGDEVSNTLTPCESTTCSSTPSAPTQCCNFFRGDEGDSGASFLFSAGGPFELPPFPACNSSNPCPPPGEPEPLPTGTGGSTIHVGSGGALATAVDPGFLSSVFCVDLPPGTYDFNSRFFLRNASPGTRVVVVFLPDCTDPSTLFTISDCVVPCGPTDTVCKPITDPFAVIDMQCSGGLFVANPTCKPGLEILVQTGCPTISQQQQGVSVPFIENLQLSLTRVASRDLINCNNSTNPLIQGVAPQTPCNGIPQ